MEELFVNYEGAPVFKGDKVYWVSDGTFQTGSFIAEYHLNTSIEPYKYFSTEGARDGYVLDNKPLN